MRSPISRSNRVVNHWDWRPEWDVDRPCWYWYLTFEQVSMRGVVTEDLWCRLRGAAWLDAVPVPWLHLTICDVGFADELAPSLVEEVRRRVQAVTADVRRPVLRLGPVEVMSSAVVLRADGGRSLHRLHERVGDATAGVLGSDVSLVHRQGFSPHVSLGYVNRPVGGEDVTALLSAIGPVSATVVPAGLALVAVTRRDGHYQWQSSVAPRLAIEHLE